eukprot:355814-Chlamydomonas_euryale.AAC.1
MLFLSTDSRRCVQEQCCLCPPTQGAACRSDVVCGKPFVGGDGVGTALKWLIYQTQAVHAKAILLLMVGNGVGTALGQLTQRTQALHAKEFLGRSLGKGLAQRSARAPRLCMHKHFLRCGDEGDGVGHGARPAYPGAACQSICLAVVRGMGLGTALDRLTQELHAKAFVWRRTTADTKKPFLTKVGTAPEQPIGRLQMLSNSNMCVRGANKYRWALLMDQHMQKKRAAPKA